MWRHLLGSQARVVPQTVLGEGAGDVAGSGAA